MATRGYALVLVMAGALVAGGCDYSPFGYTPIGEIVAAPARFEGAEVKLKGRVTDVVKLPVIEFRAYTIRDDTGSITVVTRSELPASGAQVALRGTVKSAVIIGGESLGLRVEESQRLR
ncbi:MAG: hypothetical protein FJY54_03985 [Betaproteobacteria bacterium]|nr:hypothetical protein [Betaproteobacteria bacterium]